MLGSKKMEYLVQQARTLYDSLPDDQDEKKKPFSEIEDQLYSLSFQGYCMDAIERMIGSYAMVEGESFHSQHALVSARIVMPCVSMDVFAKANKRMRKEYPALSELYRALSRESDAITKDRMEFTKKRKQLHSQYKEKLTKILNYLRNLGVIPNRTIDIFHTQCEDAYFMNSMLYALGPLYGILGAGIPDALSKTQISDNTWLSAIELTFFQHGLSDEDILKLESPEEDETLSQALMDFWPEIVCFGLLIHNLHLFTHKEAYLNQLYQDQYEPNKDASERKELRNQIQSLTDQNKALSRKNAELKGQVNSLQKQLAISPKADKAGAAATHAHNKTLKEKDAMIEQLQKRIDLLETERAEQEHRAMLEAEASLPGKPWMNETLPEEGVLFVGGHTNMVKKIRELHPNWSYISDYINLSLPSDVEVIYIWSGHLSHGLWYRINAAYQGREKMLYVQATNMARLEEEMKYELWKLHNDIGGRVTK